MPFAEELSELAVRSNATRNAGAWYGPSDGLAPGAGLIFANIPYPLFNSDTKRFQIQSGLVLVLTHECDIDQANVREFNRSLLIAPLISMLAFAQNFEAVKAEDGARQLAREIAANRVHRLMFLPPPNELLNVAEIPLGAFIYFNAITNTDIGYLSQNGARPICALSQMGLEALDLRLKNHLFRPKAQPLARTM
jgi:hypothetical protein